MVGDRIVQFGKLKKSNFTALTDLKTVVNESVIHCCFFCDIRFENEIFIVSM